MSTFFIGLYLSCFLPNFRSVRTVRLIEYRLKSDMLVVKTVTDEKIFKIPYTSCRIAPQDVDWK